MSPWRGHHDPTWDHASRSLNLARTCWTAPSPTSRSRWTGCSCRIETPECYQIEFCTKSGSARRRGRARLTRRQIVHPCSGYKTKMSTIRSPDLTKKGHGPVTEPCTPCTHTSRTLTGCAKLSLRRSERARVRVSAQE